MWPRSMSKRCSASARASHTIRARASVAAAVPASTSRPMSEKDEGFARRWSRLKQQARDDEKKLAEAPPADLPATIGAADAPPPRATDKPEEEKPFDPASLPPIENLTKDSDYSMFMRPEVPEDLRQKALRRLWAADPVLSAPDALDMHTIDYN